MTFLQLCQRLRQESGISGSGPVTVTGQTGEMKRVVDWILAADQEIQNLYQTWKFLRKEFTFTTIASPVTAEYTATSVGITDFASWIQQNVSLYKAVNDEAPLLYAPWEAFRAQYLMGSNRTQTSRPTIFTIKPDNTFRLWQIPNDAYTVCGEYYRVPFVMDEDGDSPPYPERFHMLTVWKGLMYYAAWANAGEKYTHGSTQYEILRPGLELDQLDAPLFGEPLA